VEELKLVPVVFSIVGFQIVQHGGVNDVRQKIIEHHVR
jgi:hypothetical protein